jgi:flavin reductase (DIM6/NTAB) family NADH-FMN oxidoreductase RutF
MEQIAPLRALEEWKYPEALALIISGSYGGRVNVMTLGWIMNVSTSPPLVAMSVRRRHFTHRLVQEISEFVVAFPAAGMGPAVAYAGSHTGWNEDKAAGCGLKFVPANQIRPPLVEGAFMNLECQVRQLVEASETHSVFIAEVVTAHREPLVEARMVSFGPTLHAVSEMKSGTEFSW